MQDDKKKIETVSLDTKTQEGNCVYQYIFKIILIGDANIGKTSLINRYVNKVFNDKYICTIGVDFMMKSIIYEDQTIKLQIWDTAGMEKYKQITVSYYRGAQAAIVCFDLTNKTSFENVSRWIGEFTQNCNPMFQKIIILVGNKADLTDEREVKQEEIDTYTTLNNYTYYECSSKTGDNVEDLFYNLAKILYTSYKNNMNNQIKNAIQIKKSLTGVDKFQNLILDKRKKKCSC